jgi:hypothetical protein
MSKNRNLANLIASSATPLEDLVASAPGALNTLDELAAALNDDANFATTVTNALAAKAPIANPVFTGSFTLPSGTTAQRPSSPSAGMSRFNTTTGYPEWYSTSLGAWVNFADALYGIEYLVVAGGGSGGTHAGGGGGGAGGYIASAMNAYVGSSFTVVIGAGGAKPGGNSSDVAYPGANSVFGSITAIGGGRGGRAASAVAGSGGSGGGGQQSTAPGSGTSGQGNAGGTGIGGFDVAGGGGGAGQVGANSVGNQSGAGGNGLQWLNGTYYAGGGGGGSHPAGTVNASGGLGGGGVGTGYGTTDGGDGSPNTGGGGGGAGGRSGINGQAGGAGGSGIVIIRYAGSTRGTGGSITASGGYTYHTFNSSGAFTA